MVVNFIDFDIECTCEDCENQPAICSGSCPDDNGATWCDPCGYDRLMVSIGISISIGIGMGMDITL